MFGIGGQCFPRSMNLDVMYRLLLLLVGLLENVVNIHVGLQCTLPLFHGCTRQSYLYNGRLLWYNVVLTHGRRHEYP